MSSSGPSGGGNPFEGLPIFGDLARLFTRAGPLNWEIARQIAPWVATQGEPEGNVDPIERMGLEELARVADLQVADATGLPTSVTGRVVTVRGVGRAEWANRSLDAYRPLLERLATTLGRSMTGEGGRPARGPDAGGDDADREEPADLTEQLLGNLAQMMSPVLLGMQAGFMVGHLSRTALGQYDLPIPRPESDELLLVAANIDAFATDWSLPVDDVRLWVCTSELAHHAVLGRPDVRARLTQLLDDYVSGFEVDPSALESRLGSLDPTDPSALQRTLGDPEVLLGAIQTPAQRQVLARLEALTAALEGYVDWVMDRVGRRLIASFGPLSEALRRRRVDAGEGDRFVERLFGLELGQQQYDRGQAFVRGVLERVGESGLARLWATEHTLPTPAEVDAPGLWLARLDLPGED